MKCYFNILVIGALTLKPFAFNYRAWELEKVSSIDFFDSFASDIYIEFFGLNIYRITPKINSKLNNEWCTDRIRFFFDSLSIQKLLYCYVKICNFYKIFNWYGVYLYFKYINIFNFKNSNLLRLNSFTINYFLTLNFNLYFLIFLKRFFYQFYNFVIFTSNFFINKYINIDLLNNFFFYNYLNFDFLYKKYKYIYLIGYNIRCEHPLFFYKLYSYIRRKVIVVYVFGSFFFYNFNLKNLGLSWYDFFKYIFTFKSIVNNSIFLIGSSFLNRIDFIYLHKYFSELKKYSILYNLIIDVIYVYYTLIDINLIYIGLYNDFRLLYINTKLRKALKTNFINIYSIYNLILPLTFKFFFFENEFNIFIIKNQLFLSCLLTSNLLINFNYYYHLLLPQLFLYEEEGHVIDIFLIFKKLHFIYAPKTKNVKSSLILLYNIYRLYIISYNLYKNIYFLFNKQKKYMDIFFKKNFNYLKFYNLSILNNNLFFLANKILTEFYYYFHIKIIKLSNIHILYDLNNFFFINSYSKLSQNLMLYMLLYKNNIYLLK